MKKFLIVILVIMILILAFIAYEFATAKNTYYINEKNLQIPIFTYHDIVISKDEVKEDNMQTTVKRYKKQIKGLMNLGYTPISYQDLVDYKNGNKAIPKRSFIITFDDGYESIYTQVYPISKEYNIPITVFVIDSCVGGSDYLTWEQVKEMHDSGLVSIYSHGLNHIQYDKVGPDILVQETEQAYNNLKEKLDDDDMLKVFAYPYGLYTEEGIEKMSEYGYVQNLMDSKINASENLKLDHLHRCYPLNDSVPKIILKQVYRAIKYNGT